MVETPEHKSQIENSDFKSLSHLKSQLSKISRFSPENQSLVREWLSPLFQPKQNIPLLENPTGPKSFLVEMNADECKPRIHPVVETPEHTVKTQIEFPGLKSD